MQASWNQWGGGVNAGVGNYTSNYPGAVPQAMNNFQSVPSSNPFSIPVTTTLNTTAAAPPISSQYPVSNSVYGQPTQQQQQWQQWEQWQQQYAQWHQQYGDKYQGPVPTPGVMPTGASFSSMPPLPPGAPVQPPPPDSVPPPVDKNSDTNKRPLPDSGGKDETKKLKLGKGSKSENVEDLIEQEKTFDAQFKSWESSFLKWKEQNANHPDKAQYKEYEAKWETWREQLLQKREQLRKKRENKEAEIAVAAAAAKEAALATSNMSNLSQSNFNSNMMNTNNPFANMYSMPGVYPPQDIMPNQSSGNYPSNYSMFNVPPPPTVPQMQGMPPMMPDLQNMPKLGEGPKSTQSLEFLSSTSTGGKSIPGLDLAGAGGTDKNVQNSQFSPNVPPNSALFSYNQDVTKPLHTSDDKPFNFPVPPSQSNFLPNDGPKPYVCGRPGGFNSYDQFNKGSRYSQFDGPPPRAGPNQMERNPLPFDDRFGGGNLNRDGDSKYNNDYKFSHGGRNSDFREQTPEKGPNKFGNSSYTPNLSSEKFAKYLEDEYDDSRFRDPEPLNENQHFNNKTNYQNRDNNFGGGGYNNRPNFGGRSDNSFGFNDRGQGGFNRSAPFDKNKPDSRFELFGRGMKNNQFGGRNPQDEGFDRGGIDFNREGSDFNRGSNDFNRGGSDFNHGGNEFNRVSNVFNRGGNDFNRSGNDFNREGTDVNLGANKFNRGANDFDRECNDFGRASNDLKLTEPTRPVSLLDLPPMKPPEKFEKMNAPFEELDTSSKPEETSNSHPAKNNKFAFKRNESDQNFYSDKEASVPPLKTKPPFKSGVEQNSPVPTNINDITSLSEVIQTFVASKIYEYDHISRNSDSTAGLFEPVYVFDYSHGKKKMNDFVHDSVTPLVDFKNLNKSDESSWTAGAWDDVDKKNEEPVPLPPRNRNSSSDALKLLENASDSKPEDKINAMDSLRNDIAKPSVTEKTETIQKTINSRKDDDMFADDFEEKQSIQLINEILCSPGRHTRPLKLVIIMRGPPGSGKTYTAKLIKDKEVEMGGNAPRILSLDDYFTVENDVETTDPTTGKSISKKEMQYEYDADLEPSYQESLLKSFKKTVSDGFFPFIIVDCVNNKVKNYEEMYNFAKSKGFQVFICEMDLDIAVCKKRNIHNRSETEISKIISEWEKTPFSQTLLDARSLLQSDAVAEVVMIDVEKSSVESENAESKDEDENKEKEQSNLETKAENEAEESESPKDKEGLASYMEVFCTSKWEKLDNTEEKLDQLDGVSKKRASTSFKDWLQLPEESESDLSWYTSNAKTAGDSSNVSRKKRVRWADLEERVAQQKMRSIGFVVGQTDWKRMMDPSFGGNKLTQTKYFYK